MKRIVSIALMMLVFNMGAFAQKNDKANINKTMQAYAAALKISGNRGGLLFVYPKVFGVVNKQAFMQRLDNKPSDISKMLVFEDLVVRKISEVTIVGGIKYALVSYQDKYSYSIASAEQSEAARRIASRLATSHKAVTLAKSKKMVFTSNRQAYAIQDLTKGWKLVEKNKAMESILQKILPASMLKLP